MANAAVPIDSASVLDLGVSLCAFVTSARLLFSSSRKRQFRCSISALPPISFLPSTPLPPKPGVAPGPGTRYPFCGNRCTRHLNFRGQEIVAEYGEIEDCDVKPVTSMEELFADWTDFNENISRWDTENVTNMYTAGTG